MSRELSVTTTTTTTADSLQHVSSHGLAAFKASKAQSLIHTKHEAIKDTQTDDCMQLHYGLLMHAQHTQTHLLSDFLPDNLDTIHTYTSKTPTHTLKLSGHTPFILTLSVQHLQSSKRNYAKMSQC